MESQRLRGLIRGMLGLKCESGADGLWQKGGWQSLIYSGIFIDILMFKALSLTTFSVRSLWLPSGPSRVFPQSTDVPDRSTGYPKLPLQYVDSDRRDNAGTLYQLAHKPTWSCFYWPTIRYVPAASASSFSFSPWVSDFDSLDRPVVDAPALASSISFSRLCADTCSCWTSICLSCEQEDLQYRWVLHREWRCVFRREQVSETQKITATTAFIFLISNAEMDAAGCGFSSACHWHTTSGV